MRNGRDGVGGVEGVKVVGKVRATGKTEKLRVVIEEGREGRVQQMRKQCGMFSSLSLLYRT